MKKFKQPKIFFVFLAGLIFVCFLVNTSAFSQVTQARLEGRVADTEGEGLPGAEINVKNMETGYLVSAVTRNDGTYIVTGIQPGKYEIRVSLSGFATQVRQGMTFAVAANLKIDFTLEQETVSEEIVVTAEAPIIEVSRSDISSVVDRQKIEDLPLLDRDFNDLTVLQAGVLDGRNNALQSGSNEVIVDGVSNEAVIQGGGGQYLPADAIQEFRIMTNNAVAEYGNAAGMIRTAVTRSGTNDFRGRVNYFFRDETLSNPNYFVKHEEYEGAELSEDEWEKAPYARHNFGGFLGGPIVKDKAHFFLLYEGTQMTQYSTITSPLVEHETVEQTNSINSFFAKINYQINQRNLLNFRISSSPTKGENLGVGGLNTLERAYSVEDWGVQFVGNWTIYPSNNSMNEVRVLVQRSYSDYMPTNPDSYSIVRPSGNFGKDPNYPQESYAHKVQIVENFSLFLGNHNIKAGLEFLSVPSGSPRMELYYPGQYTFTTDAEFNPANPGTYPFTLVYNSLGEPISMDIPYYFFTPFIQDSWRVSSRLILNIGLRYNYYDLEGINMKNGSIKHLNPRLGFSYDLTGDGKTVIRGGTGTFTANLHTNPAAPIIFWDQFQLKVKVFPGYPDPTVPNPFMPFIPEFAAFDTEYEPGSAVAPWTFQSSIGIQREVLTDLSLSADIVYSKGYDAIRQKYLNPIIPGTLVVRPDPDRGQVITVESAGKSEYKGLFLTLNKRYARGWALNVAYTLSKAMGDTEKYGSEDAPWSNDPDAWERAYGRMRNDARHKLTASGTVDLPYGFQVSGIFYYRSAYPWNAVYAEDINLDGMTGDYVDQNRNSREGFDEMWLNLRLSWFLNVSFARFQVFAEGYNVTNRTNFGSPHSIYGTPLFGKPVSASSPRMIQIGARLGW
jgi:hypothetical protein